MTSRKQKLTLFIIFIIAFALRIFFLETLPAGITDDETALSYNAYLIAKTGKDEWGSFLPLQFRSFGDWKLPVYIYLLSFVFKFFPLSVFWARTVSALLGSLTVILIFYFILLFFKEEKWKYKVALLSSLVLAFNPWHLGFSRFAGEPNIGLFFFIAALFLFKYFLNNRSKKVYFFLWLIVSIVCFYSYHVYRVLLPLVFMYLYLFNQKKEKRKKLFVKMFLVLIVLVLLLFISTQGRFLTRLLQVGLFSDKGTIDQINEFRGACLNTFPFYFCRLFFNKLVFWIRLFLFNYFSHLSPQFLFFSAFEKGYVILPHYSYFYPFNILFFIIGVIALIKERKSKSSNRGLLFFLLLISPFAGALTGRGNFARAFPMVIPIVIFSAIGIVYSINFLKEKRIFYLSFLIFLIYGFFIFELVIRYLTYFPLWQAKYSHYEYKPLFKYLQEVESDYDHIYISRAKHDARQYIFYLFYFKIKPEEYFNLERKVEVDEEGWAWVRKLGKFEFVDNVESLENYPENSLLIVDPATVKKFPKPKKMIKYPNETTAFNVYDVDQVKLKLAEENEN